MLFPKGTAYSVVPTRNEAAVASLELAVSIDDKLPNFTITASQPLSCKPMQRAKSSRSKKASPLYENNKNDRSILKIAAASMAAALLFHK